MNQPAPGASQAQAAPSTRHISIWDRLLDDLHKRPRRYINGVLIAGVPVLLVIVGYKFWSSQQQEARGEVASQWVAVSDRPPAERVPGLEELAPKLEDPDQQAKLLYDLATTQKELGDEAATNDSMLQHYREAIAAAEKLKSNHPKSLWALMPIRPTTSAGTKSPAAIDQILEYAKAQVAWLEKHPYSAKVEADPGLSVTFELEDGRKFVVGKLFSRAAPYHVQNFVTLARQGYFDGTAFTRLTQGYKKDARPKQGETPPTIAIEGGHPMTKVTPEDREDDESMKDLGYSVREEPNSVRVSRGSVVAVPDSITGGDSPSRFKIYAEEPYYPQETAFAEVTEGLDVIDSLVNSPAADLNPSRPRDMHRIKKVTVEGSVLQPPEAPFPPEFKLPEGPKPESQPESQPESRPESSETRGSDTQPK